MSRTTRHLAGALLAASLLSAPATAQLTRVVINGVPTNMFADWGQVVAVPDPSLPDTFLAIMPLSAVSTWAEWDPDVIMNMTFGAGNWDRMRMSAVDWAYLSPDACAHQPAAGSLTPESLLTSDYDYGPYSGVPGVPLFPGATMSFGSNLSYVQGLGGSGFTRERWQLRTRGFFPNMLWNACPGSLSITPNFSGFLGARFTYQIL